MEGFWRSLCECKLLPLTSAFFPDEKKLNTLSQYKKEECSVDFLNKVEKIKDNLCLRLTQNF